MKILNLISLEEPDIKTEIRPLADDRDRVIAHKWQMLLDLIRYLEADGPAPSAFAYVCGREIFLSPANRYNRAMIRVTVDWPDYGPLQDGLPTMHYRLKIMRRVGGPSRDGRSRDLAEVKRLIWEGFGWGQSTDGETKE